MENKRITINFKSYENINCNKNSKCTEYRKVFIQNKAKVNRLLTVRQIENEVLDDFLKENDIKISELCILLFYRDGAVNEELLTAYDLSFSRVKLDFLNRNDFTYEYKQKYNKVDFAKLFAEQKVKTRNLKLRTLIDLEIRKYYTKKGFTSFQEYMKNLFNAFGLYPEGMFEEVKRRISTQKKRYEKFDEFTAISKAEKELYPASFTVSKYEKVMLINPFVEYLKRRGLSISKLVRFELMENRLISYSDIHLDDEDIAKIHKLNYNAPKIETNIDKVEEKIKKKERETVVCVIPDKADLRENLKGSFGTFVKVYVFKKYGMYPEIRSKDISRLFINKKKSSDFRHRLKELTGGRIV